jgi:hypothetical protein
MRLAKILAWIGLVAMSVALIYGFTVGDFLNDGREIVSNPWGIVSLVDLYVGFTLFSIWIVYREESRGRAVVWVVFMMILGFFTGALYTLIALYSCDNNWQKFWLGARAELVGE